jgi:hypothetical protein
MSTTRTRPIRILVDDLEPIRLLAGLRHASAAEVIHEAIVEYFAKHRADLAAVHAETQDFIARGDIEGLAAAMRAETAGVAARLASRNGRSRTPVTA